MTETQSRPGSNRAAGAQLAGAKSTISIPADAVAHPDGTAAGYAASRAHNGRRMREWYRDVRQARRASRESEPGIPGAWRSDAARDLYRAGIASAAEISRLYGLPVPEGYDPCPVPWFERTLSRGAA
jgi:hypothetical protein